MTDATIQVLVQAVAPTLLALGTLLTVYYTWRKQNKKTDHLIVKTEEVHEQVNSNLSKATESLAAANTQIAELKRMVDKLINGKKGKAP